MLDWFLNEMKTGAVVWSCVVMMLALSHELATKPAVFPTVPVERKDRE